MLMPTFDQWIQISVAIGTIGAVIVALWGNRLSHMFGLGPKLNLSLVDAQGELVIPTGRSDSLRYYHVKVFNSHKWSPANNVRVMITGLFTLAADGNLVRHKMVGSLQLMWRFANVHPQYSVVGPDDYADLGYISDGKDFVLTPFVRPNNFPHSLSAKQKMVVELQAFADNTESLPLCIEISWDGVFTEDTLEMAKHLVVKEVDGVIESAGGWAMK